MKDARSKIIIKSGIIFILTNFLLAVFNLIVGLISGSLAIVSDSAHSLIDATSGFVIIISEKLKAERIATIIIALIIIAAGIHILIEAIENLVTPEAVDYNAPTIIILVMSILAKLTLAIYLKLKGRAFNSSVLSASGAETMNDTLISIAILFSVIIYFITGVNVESYVSIIIAFIIFKVGLEFIFPHLSHHHHHPLEQNPDHDHCGKK